MDWCIGKTIPTSRHPEGDVRRDDKTRNDYFYFLATIFVHSALHYGVVVVVEESGTFAKPKQPDTNDEADNPASYVTSFIENVSKSIDAIASPEADEEKQPERKRIAAVACIYPPGHKEVFSGANLYFYKKQ